MSDPLRTDGLRLPAAEPDASRDAKIEQLLLAGLDHYFASQYDHAISVWTRVLFLDRSHARARAYIERARSALAERQRQSEELLHNGVEAFRRGDGSEARRLVQAALDGGAPTDEALAILDRLNRLAQAPAADPRSRVRPAHRVETARAGWPRLAVSGLTVALLFVLALVAAGLYSATVWGPLDWRATFPLQRAPGRAAAAAPRSSALPLPRRGEAALTRARTLAADGHLRDALLTLDLVRPTDPQKPDADRLRGEIQLQLLALTSIPAQPAAAGRDTADNGTRPGQ
jgi:hypothetical protein